MLSEIYKAISARRSVSSDEMARELGVTRDLIAAGLETLDKANLIESVIKNTGCGQSARKGCSNCGGVCGALRLVMWQAKSPREPDEYDT